MSAAAVSDSVPTLFYLVLTEQSYAEGRGLYRTKPEAIAHARAYLLATGNYTDVIIEEWNVATNTQSYVDF